MSIVTKGYGPGTTLVTQGYGLSDIVGPGLELYKSIFETLYLTGYFGSIWTAYNTLSEGVSVNEDRQMGVSKFLEDALSIHFTLGFYNAILTNFIQPILLSPSFSRVWEAYNVITEQVSVTEYRLMGIAQGLLETLQLVDLLSYIEINILNMLQGIYLTDTTTYVAEYFRTITQSMPILEAVSKIYGMNRPDSVTITDEMDKTYGLFESATLQLQDSLSYVSQWYRLNLVGLNIVTTITKFYGMNNLYELSMDDYLYNLYRLTLQTILQVQDPYSYIATFFRDNVIQFYIEESMHKWMGLYEAISMSIGVSLNYVSHWHRHIAENPELGEYYTRTVMWFRHWNDTLQTSDVFNWWWVLTKYLTVYLKDTTATGLMRDTSASVYVRVHNAVVNLKELATDVYTKIKGDD